MNALAYANALEIREEQELRQKGWIGSLILHAILIALLFLAPQIGGEELALTEITWLEEPGEVVEPAYTPPVPAAAPEPVVQEDPAPQPTTQEKFVRAEAEEAVVEPKPQSLTARDDRLSDRLNALRDNRPTIAVEAPKNSSLLKTPTTEVPISASKEQSELRRETTTKAAPIELRRDNQRQKAPRLATVAPTKSARREAIIPKDADLTVRRTLAGAGLAGPAADRPVREHVMPVFPDWAKREGVEGTVTLGFVVLPDGRVKANVLVHRTSGYQDFDRRAQDALRQWRFEPLPAGSTQEQWGTITMHFRLTS